MPRTTTVRNYAFYNCKMLTSVEMPDVKSIGNYAYNGCDTLTKASIPNVTSIGNYAFSNCAMLASADMQKVKSIGTGAFDGCESLKSMTIPDITSLEHHAFSACESLESVYLPKRLSDINNFAFARCYALTDVYYEGTAEDRKNISVGTYNDALLNAEWHYGYEFDRSGNLEILGDYAGKVEAKAEEKENGVVVTVTIKDASVDKETIRCFSVSGDGTMAKKLTGNVSGDKVTFEAEDKNAKIFIWDDKLRPITEAYGG